VAGVIASHRTGLRLPRSLVAAHRLQACPAGLLPAQTLPGQRAPAAREHAGAGTRRLGRGRAGRARGVAREEYRLHHAALGLPDARPAVAWRRHRSAAAILLPALASCCRTLSRPQRPSCLRLPTCDTCSRACHLTPVPRRPRCLACCSRSLQVQYAELATTPGGAHGPLYLGESDGARCPHAGGGHAGCCWSRVVFSMC
jgi:hypothetical protein